MRIVLRAFSVAMKFAAQTMLRFGTVASLRNSTGSRAARAAYGRNTAKFDAAFAAPASAGRRRGGAATAAAIALMLNP
jgi:hypothetical protein